MKHDEMLKLESVRDAIIEHGDTYFRAGDLVDRSGVDRKLIARFLVDLERLGEVERVTGDVYLPGAVVATVAKPQRSVGPIRRRRAA